MAIFMEESIFVIAVDILTVAGSFLAAYYVRQIGGKVGHNSLTYMVFGFFLFGIGQLFETLVGEMIPTLDHDIVEWIHRVPLLIGTVLIVIGYARLAKFLRS